MCLGSNFTKRCLVFVPCVGKPSTDIVWLVNESFILNTDPSDRVYTTKQKLAPSPFLLFGLFYLLLLGYDK